MNRHQAADRQEWVPPPPFDVTTPYALGDYPEDRVRRIMFKYLERSTNLALAWARVCHHMPELIGSGRSLSCLEFGTAHGALLEVWRALGHVVVGTDFPWRAGRETVLTPSRPWHRAALKACRDRRHGGLMAKPLEGWAYQPIIESLGLDVRMIDGRSRPYPFEDKSFDVVCAYQAIDAFAPPEEWPDVVAEFCRIARRSVVVGFNPLPIREAETPGRKAAARDAWLRLERFSAYGLTTVFTEFGTTRRGLHPTAMKFMQMA